MRFFIIALLINLALLALPLNPITMQQNKTNPKKLTVVLTQQSKMTDTNKQIINEPSTKQQAINKPTPKQQTPKPLSKKPSQKQTKQTPKTTQTTTQTKTQNTQDTDIITSQNTSNKATQTIETFTPSDGFCKKNVVFSHINNDYPKKAKMLRKSGVYEVDVRFKVNKHKIVILDISGEELFAKHTKKLFANLSYKVLDKRAYDCVFFQTIKFQSK